ncbi:hypothetical protein [uncultured Sunxiuqinia sp.]|uniref:hypothetical protein n=1 Tax=uncultured Sunxiuqinia sp. TaxID=1573825 RepID=UPI002AA8F952|nr:hypothetical protein [uncultured Sunxiuqinia sp.]
MDNAILLKEQLDKIIIEYKQLSSKSQYGDLSDLSESVELISLVTKSVAAVQRIAGEKSEYYKSIKLVYNENFNYDFLGVILKNIIGVVQALKDDLENDYLKTLNELIHADIFSDYLDMAEYLLSEGYKDPSAVIAGSTLESHLRKLCEKNSISIEFENTKGKVVAKKADLLNSELAKEEIYNKTFQKQITAWLDLRNNAAHGKYEEYKDTEVKLMIRGITNFLITYPA